jgi:hypothetical protein
MSLEIPTIHLNGTSKKELLEGIDSAYDAINTAITALAAAGPNGRDYYSGLDASKAGYDRLQKAAAEHYVRLGHLHQIKSELQELAEGICNQIR